MKKALINQPDCSLVRPRSPRTVLSATAMALRLTYASAAAAHSQANTANRPTLGRAEDCFSLGCGSLISVLTLRASVCPGGLLCRFDHAIEQPVHFTPRSFIKSEADRAADKRVLEDALAHQQVLLDREKGIEAGLHRDDRGERPVDAVGLGRVAGFERAPERDQDSDKVGAGQSADNAAPERIKQRDA